MQRSPVIRLPSPRRNVVLEEILRISARACPFDRLTEFWNTTIATHGLRGKAALGRVDRYYLLVELLHRPDALNPWVFDRCREVEKNPDGYLDLWAREHYKSTIITFAGSIQEILNDPEITIGIFSHTKPTARKFFTQIKEELESNEELKGLYPEVLWQDPKRDAVRWSDEKGIAVKRKSNPREATLEAHGLVDGQPTGSHFRLMVYDDVVTLESVTSPEMVTKTTYAHGVSDNLGARGPDGRKRKWHIGTRYKFGDTYQDLLDRKVLKPRIYPATHDGTPTGVPVLLTQAVFDKLRHDTISSIFAAQQLMNPAAGLEAMFRKEWIESQFLSIRPATLNVYILCDPASSRKKGSDRTAIMVVGIDAGRNKYLLGGYCHKMGLSERWTKLRDLHAHWSTMPGVQVVRVGYERYGMLDAMEHFEERMLVEKCGFEIVELAWPREGGNAKYDRIQRLEPDFKNRRWWFAAVPTRLEKDAEGNEVEIEVEFTAPQLAVIAKGQAYRVWKPARQMDHEASVYALNKMLFDEYVVYPYVNHDDALDCLSRIYDIDPAPPILIEAAALEPEAYSDGA